MCRWRQMIHYLRSPHFKHWRIRNIDSICHVVDLVVSTGCLQTIFRLLPFLYLFLLFSRFFSPVCYSLLETFCRWLNINFDFYLITRDSVFLRTEQSKRKTFENTTWPREDLKSLNDLVGLVWIFFHFLFYNKIVYNFEIQYTF